MAVNAIPVERKAFTVGEYEQLISAGVLGEDDRYELIEGDILTMSPIGGLHIQVVNRLNRLLVLLLKERAVVSIQNPIRLTNSEPQPDVAILQSNVNDRPARVPRAGDVLLVIEVADTSVALDRAVKIPLFGREGIPEAWLVDLAQGTIEVYRGPSPSGYRNKQTLGPGDILTIQTIVDARLTADEIIGQLPPEK
jgi:Uma2 family endonuclease